MSAKPKTVRVRVSFECEVDGWGYPAFLGRPTLREMPLFFRAALCDFEPLKRLRVERVPEKRRKSK
jgi:hypothetical protein